MTGEARRKWVRFEGPGKLHVRRWHRVTRSPTGREVTLCGLIVINAPVFELPSEGPQCATCLAIASRPRGGYM